MMAVKSFIVQVPGDRIWQLINPDQKYANLLTLYIINEYGDRPNISVLQSFLFLFHFILITTKKHNR
jgi:hypothetical protein